MIESGSASAATHLLDQGQMKLRCNVTWIFFAEPVLDRLTGV